MTTGQKIYECRKRANLTQEGLADALGVTRQAVSRWESDLSFPETEKMIELCRLFSISADELLFPDREGRESAGATHGEGPSEEKEGGAPHAPEAPMSEGERAESVHEAPMFEEGGSKTAERGERWHYEYVSRFRFLGLPLLHVNIGFGMYRAKGFFAIGVLSAGFFSIGIFSLGLFALGLFALGLAAFGVFVAGGAAAGSVALGLAAFGAIAVGVHAMGGIAVGWLAFGGLAMGHIAAGGWAQGWLALGIRRASGENAFLVTEMLPQFLRFLDENLSASLAGYLRAIANILEGSAAISFNYL